MVDRMFSSEDDSVNVGRHGLAARADHGSGGRPHQVPGEDAMAGVAQRLQDRLERHLWLLHQLQSEQLHPETPGVPELLETTRRMRRDTESLLLLCGQDPGVRTGGSRRLSDVLGDAASAAEEPRRVDVRSVPAATMNSAASVELLHVLAELVDHVTTGYPGARVDVAGHVESRGGVTVEVSMDGDAIRDPAGPRAAAAADLLAQRSGCGIALHYPPGGPPTSGYGLVASVYCPAAAVTVEEVAWSPPQRDDLSLAGTSGYGAVHHANGNGNGSGRPAAASMLDSSQVPTYAPSVSSQVDELFGPMLDLPLEPADDGFATPIFEAIASAWFRSDPEPAPDHLGNRHARNGSDPLDWESPYDEEWRAAAARAVPSEPAPLTSSGLPRRRPGNLLFPPSRTQTPASDSNSGERVPDRVRSRLSTYQRGLRKGRHRATDPDELDTED